MKNPNKPYHIIFGLTADPIHKGHEQVIINAVEFCKSNKINLDQITVIPVYRPHLIGNKKAPIAHYDLRVEMCQLVSKRLSILLNSHIKTSVVEKEIFLQTRQLSYSYQTIKHLKLTNALFMVSADHFIGRWPLFRKWKNWQELLQHSGLLINQRPSYKVNQNYIAQLKKYNKNIFINNTTTTIDVSSTQIRKNINAKKHLSSDIYQLITENHLYQVK